MSDEALVVVGILALIAGMILVILRQQRRKEARLAALAEIEIPILSTARAALIIVASMVPAPVVVAMLAAQTEEGRRHSVAAVLLSLGAGVVAMFGGLRLARRYARRGLLRYAPPRLELQLGAQRTYVDLDQPCQLAETSAVHPTGISLQVLALKQGDRLLAFSYGLPLGRKPYGAESVANHIEPVVDAEARVIHDRIRQRFPG